MLRQGVLRTGWLGNILRMPTERLLASLKGKGWKIGGGDQSVI